MRMKRTKKVLSAFLAAVMVLTALPFTVLAATDSDLNALNTAISAYEAKMANGEVYTNMKDAYSAYIKAKEYVDAYQYGDDTTLDLANAAADLTAKTNAMGAWTPAKGTVTGSFEGDNSNDNPTYNAADYYKSLIYSKQTTAAPAAESEEVQFATGGISGKAKIKFNIYSPPTVILYDGSSEISVPVMFAAATTRSGSWVTAAVKCKVFACYPTTSGWSLPEVWKGIDGKTNFRWLVTGDGGTTTGNSASNLVASSSWDRDTWRWMANSLRYDATNTFGSGEYYKEITPSWEFRGGKDDTNASGAATVTIAGSAVAANAPVYILNYDALIKALNTAAQSVFADVKNYDNDWADMTALMTAIDSATSFNPSASDYDYASDTGSAVAKCASAIGSCINAINTAKNSLTVSDTSYNQLRSAVSGAKATYNRGNADGAYTADSWSAFETAYQAAYAAINDVDNNGYKANGEVAAVATALNTAFANLQETTKKVDTSALIAAIDKAESNSDYVSYFTPESWAALTQLVSEAKTAVWGAEADYKVGASALEDSAENQQIVADYASKVEAKIPSLRINHDAMIILEGAAVSYNSILAEYEAIDGHLYYNYSELVEVVSQAKIDMATLDNTDMTTVDAMIGAYTSILQKIRTAINELEYAFTTIPNGTVAVHATGTTVGSANSKTGTDSMVNTSDIQGSVALGFSFPSNAVILRTTHDASTFELGNMMLYWGAWRDYDEHLLFINLRDTNTNTGELGTWAVAAGQTPHAKGIPSLITEKGLTTLNSVNSGGATFKLEDLYCIEADSKISAIATDANGNYITDKGTNLLDTVLSTETNDGGTANTLVMHGKGSNTFGGNTYAGRYTMSVAADTAKTLTASTTPSSKTYKLSANVGASTVVSYQPMSAWSVFRHDTAAYTVSATVVDISYLFDLIKECDSITDNSRYTTDSWNRFATALTAAKAPMEYTSMSADEITSEAKSRYTNLWMAYKSLQDNTYQLTFNYKDANGDDQSQTFTALHGDKLADYASQVTPADYEKSGWSYTFTGWSPAVTDTAVVLGAATYEAQYDAKLNNADFTALDSAVEALTTLADNTYYAGALEALNMFITGLTYYNYTQEQRDLTMGDTQALIDAETALVQQYQLTASSIDASAAQAALDQAKAAVDSDAYDMSAVNSFTLTRDVEVNGKTIAGMVYADQASLDAAIQALITSMQPMEYTVSLNGQVLGTYAYGTRIEVDGDGTVRQDPDMESEQGGAQYAWYYSYNSIQVTKTTAPKYMTTAPAYGFVVKGNTFLTTELAQSEDTQSYVVTFVNGINGHVFDVVYTSGSVTMPQAPVCPYYTFSGYDNGAAAGSAVTVTGDTTITANYTVNAIETYHVIVSSNEYVEDDFQYNDRVTLTDDTVEMWVSYKEGGTTNATDDPANAYRVVAYGPTITFRACEDIEIWGMTLADLDWIDGDPYGTDILVDADDNHASSITRNGIVKADTKFSMIGSFALPEGATAVEYGMLFTTESGKELTLTNATTDSTIKRLKASKHTGENDSYGQYVISIKSTNLNGDYTFTYRSYMTYTLNGKTYTVYADAPVVESVTF